MDLYFCSYDNSGSKCSANTGYYRKWYSSQHREAFSYQWYVDGTLINGATTDTWEPLVIGDYTVVITDASGCEGTSPAYTVTSVGINSLNSENALIIYPNPANENLRMFKLQVRLQERWFTFTMLPVRKCTNVLWVKITWSFLLMDFQKECIPLSLDNGTVKKMHLWRWQNKNRINNFRLTRRGGDKSIFLFLCLKLERFTNERF